MGLRETLAALPGGALREIVFRVIDVWPEHAEFLETRFAGDSIDQLRSCESTAQLVVTLVGGQLDRTIAGYRGMCENFLREEEYFRFHRRYRHSTFAEIDAAGYLTGEYMNGYMRGLLLSQILWQNHARVMEVYTGGFLRRRGGRDRLLEVGPGHGLLLALAARERVRDLQGWDISDVSIALTRASLDALGAEAVRLTRQDVAAAQANEEPFDLVVASELLEHVEAPRDLLRSLLARTARDGRIFLNVPVNSPAPDHIYLWRTPEEFFEFVADNGVRLLRTWVFPLTGYTEERARQRGYTLSCVVVGCPDGR